MYVAWRDLRFARGRFMLIGSVVALITLLVGFLAGLTGGKAAKVLGLGPKGDRTIRRWVGEDTPIPYAAWALLCDYAGLGLIWKEA